MSEKWAKAEAVNYEDNGWENFLNFERKEVAVSGPSRSSAGASDLLAVPYGEGHSHTSIGASRRSVRDLAGGQATKHNPGKILSHF
jgi:hypothetical protein